MLKTVLLIEPNKKLRELIMYTLQSSFGFDVEEARGTGDILLGSQKKIDLIICNHCNNSYRNILIMYRTINPHIPFILLKEEDKIIKDVEITEQFNLTDSIEPLCSYIEANYEIDSNYKSQPYTKISIHSLIHFLNLEDDLYIEIGEGDRQRFIKLFAKEDPLDQEAIDRYRNKNLQYLYLKKETYTWIRRLVDSQIKEIISNPEKTYFLDCSKNFIDPNDKIFEISKKFTKEISEKKEKIMQRIRKSKTIMQQFQKIDRKDINNNYLKIRMQLTAHIACAIAKTLSWDSDATFEKLIYVSYLHDIALFDNVELSKIKNLEEFQQLKGKKGFTEKDKELFLKHPEIGEAILSKDPNAPMDASKIIRQHHENPKGEGFPDNIKSHMILPFSAILIISIECAQYIIDNPSWDIEIFYEMAKNKFISTNFHKPLKALKVFTQKNYKTLKIA